MARTPVLNVTTLRRLKALPWATDHQLEQLLPHFSLQRVERQMLLFSEGEASKFLYLLIAGAAKLSRPSGGGEEVLVSLIAPGEFFGITSLMSGMTRGFQCQAFSDCWIAKIPADKFVSTLLGISFSDFSALMGSTGQSVGGPSLSLYPLSGAQPSTAIGTRPAGVGSQVWRPRCTRNHLNPATDP